MPTQGAVIKSYVSAFTAVDTREINRQVTDIHNENSLTEILNFSGRATPVTQWFYRTYVNESLFKLGDSTGATVTGSGTATVGTTLTVATSGYARKADLVIFPSGLVGYVTNVVTASSQDTLTIKSVSGANITHTAGEKLGIFSNAVGEKSDSVANLKYGLTSYINKIQIFRERSNITDVQNAATLEIEFNGQNKWMAKDHIEKALLMKAKINAAFMAGEMSTTSMEDTSPAFTDPTNSGNVQTTRGIDKYVTSYGVNDQVASLGTWVLSDLDDLLDQLTAAKAPKEYLAIGPSNVRRKISTYLKNLGSSGITSVRLNIGGRELDFMVEQLTHGDYTISFADLPIANHPDIFSQTPIAKSLYFIPKDHTVNVQGGGKAPCISTKYIKQANKYGTDMVGEIHSGALNPVSPSGTVNDFDVQYITAQGLEILGAQFLARHRVLS